MKTSLRYLSFFVLLTTCSLLFSQTQIQLNPAPTREVGQANLTQSSLNLVEGRELNGPQGIALDLNVNPPILYISDTNNNRVLGFRNANTFTNGQKADIVIGQVDLQTTAAQGPSVGANRTTGLTAPFGLAVDSSSNLYVVDAGNNRVLRFPTPFSQTGIVFPDLVIGQPSFSTRAANVNGISASTLALAGGNGAFQSYLAFDSSKNLWLTDGGNNRVLRYPAALLGTGAKNGPMADLVLGQLDFATTTANPDQTNLTFLSVPTGIAFDQQGRLFISESTGSVRSRILIFSPPFTRNGQPATRILGVVPSTVLPQPPSVSEQQFERTTGNLFIINNGVGIADTLNNRLLGFKSVDQFTSNVLTQQAQIQYLFGQTDFSSNRVNQGMPEAGPDRLFYPTAVAVSGTELFIADTGNNRVIAVPYSSVAIGQASRVLGQDTLSLNSPNLVEGREFRFTSSPGGAAEAGVTTDLKSNPPHLYVADTYNNRILCYRDLRTVKPGDRANMVIGQPDFSHTEANYPANDSNPPTASSLFGPTGLIVDPSGNLYVADSGNGRVLRFPAPFSKPGFLPTADLVLGQRSFTSSKIADASAATMSAPYGLAFASNNGLLVSDLALNRVLFFSGASGALTNGQAASIVFGQPDFFSSAAGSSAIDNRFNSPRGIATDTDDRLYVADSVNGRVVIFERAPAQQNDPRSSRTLAAPGARGIYVNPTTSEIWVAAGNAINRYPPYISQPLTGFQPNASISDGGVLAVTQDAYGNLYTADQSNRVQINYPGLTTVNAASLQASAGFAPGSIASIFALFTNQFGTVTAAASGSPLPTQLANVQVLLNNSPVPLYFVGPNQINFVLPNNAPTNGLGDLLVLRLDTGQILGNFPIPLNVASPAIFILNATSPGQGQVAAINTQDGSINGKDHPAINSSIVSFFGTGEGMVPGAPADGVAATGPVSTATKPMVIIGTDFVPDDNITYSGLAPGLVGVWQVNVKIPENVAATAIVSNTPVVFVVSGIASNGPTRLQTTLWVTGKSN